MSQHGMLDKNLHSQPPTRIWRLQYGPCWCHSPPHESSSFDYVRLRRTSADFGAMSENLFVVSERVIDGSASLYRQVYSTVPDPKLVVATGTCPTSSQFWEDLPNGWIPVEEVLPVDVRVEECVSGKPEALVAALLSHLFAVKGQAPRRRRDKGTEPLTQSASLETHNA